MAETPIIIRSKPGIKRDGTKLEGGFYLDGRWCRFEKGLPRKMGGYRAITSELAEVPYGIHSFSANQLNYIHLGSASLLSQRRVNNLGNLAGSADRTPAGLSVDSNNLWQFDAIFDIPNLNGMCLVAHAAPNLDDIASTTSTPIYFGLITGSGALVASGQDPVSGGIVTVGNYLVGFGNDGLVQWSAANDLVSATADSSPVTQQKIVAGRVYRGGQLPSALLWSLDSLLLMSQNPSGGGGSPLWLFTTLTSETSILSTRSIIEYDGIYYWLGVDRPLMFNGVVREVPNLFNMDYFYDNLNYEQRQKVFAYKVPRFGEIWWCYPRGTATECTHAIILNVRDGYWYDTELPNSGRSDGIYAKVYNKPLMTGVRLGTTGYRLWQHETGVDQVIGDEIQPVPSHFETGEITMLKSGNPINKSTHVGWIEPDFVQQGDLELTIKGRSNARAPILASATFTITEANSETNPADAEHQIVPLKELRRLMSFKFSSNTVGGYYEMGDTFAHIAPADGRMTT